MDIIDKNTLDEIVKLVNMLDTYHYNTASARRNKIRLVAIYNSNQIFNRGKKENINCGPCVLKVLNFFIGFVAGYNYLIMTQYENSK